MNTVHFARISMNRIFKTLICIVMVFGLIYCGYVIINMNKLCDRRLIKQDINNLINLSKSFNSSFRFEWDKTGAKS